MLSLDLDKIKRDFSNFHFYKGPDFTWNPELKTISYERLSSQQDFAQLLHEIAHAKLGHKNYPTHRNGTICLGICSQRTSTKIPPKSQYE